MLYFVPILFRTLNFNTNHNDSQFTISTKYNKDFKDYFDQNDNSIKYVDLIQEDIGFMLSKLKDIKRKFEN